MALSSSSLCSTNPFTNFHLHKPILAFSKFTMKSIDSSESGDDTSPAVVPPKPNSTGLGFGQQQKQQQKNSKRERAPVIRRPPVEKPTFGQVKANESEQVKEQGKSEQAFLLTWLGLGSIIFLQGILLSVSGFLPEELDNLCVKYVYPSFTPTVVFFFTGMIVYGVSKYLQNEEANKQK